MAHTDIAAYNVTAVYPDMAAARYAIGTLEDHGVEADDIALLGRAAEDAAASQETTGRDEQFLQRTSHTAVGGIAAGSGVGATLGFLAGIASFGIPGVGPVVGGGILALVAGGSVAGAGVGLTAASLGRMKQSQAWEATLEDVRSGRVVVGVHTAHESAYRRASAALEDTGAERLHHFDGEGNPLPEG